MILLSTVLPKKRVLGWCQCIVGICCIFYASYGGCSVESPEIYYRECDKANDLLFNQKKHHDAFVLYQSLVDKYPQYPQAYSGLGDTLLFMGEYQQAKEWFLKGSKLFPKNSEFYSGLTAVYVEQLMPKEAIRYARKVLKIDPHNSEARKQIGSAYVQQHKYKKAEKWYLETIRLNKLDYDAYCRLGQLYSQLFRYEDALKTLYEGKEQCKNLLTRKTETFFDEMIARVYTKKGDFKKAEEILVAITNRADSFPDRYWGCPFQALGILYSHMTISDQKKKVMANYQKAADIESFKPFPQYEAAQIFYEYGDYENALVYIEKALALTSSDSTRFDEFLLLKGYICIAQKHYDQARDIFNKICVRGKGAFNKEGIVGLGHIDIVEKKFDEAKKKFLSTIEQKTSFVYTDLGLGWVCSNCGEHEKALLYYEKVLAVRPTHLWALLGKGNSLMGLKRIDEAEKIFNDVLTVDPVNEYAFAELGLIAYNRDENARAEELFKKALELNQESYTCPYEGLGLLYLRQGRSGEAAQYLKKAIDINPEIEYKKYNGLARIYITEGRLQEAIALLEKSRSNYPYDSEAQQLLDEVNEMQRNA